MTTSSILFGLGFTIVTVFFISLPFRGGNGERYTGRRRSKRLDLLQKKAEIYAAIREIDGDVMVGKLEPPDHRALRRRYVGEAVNVLKSLDALPSEDPIERAIERDIERWRETGTFALEELACPACGATADAEDHFCARCGARLGEM